MADTQYFDNQETREAAAREAELFAALQGQIAHAKANAPYFSDVLADIDPAAITDRSALANLPVFAKRRVDRTATAEPTLRRRGGRTGI